MTVDTFLGYLGRIPVLRAERLLDAAGAAHPSKDWIESHARVLAADDGGDESETGAGRPVSPFRLNGRPVALVDLKSQLAGALGAGFGTN